MPQMSELYQLLAEARLECYFAVLEKELKINSVAQLKQLQNYAELMQIGMKKEEIERLRKVLKGNTMNKLKKFKTLHSESLDGDNPVTSKYDSSTTHVNLDEFREMLRQRLVQRSISASAAGQDSSLPLFDDFLKSFPVQNSRAEIAPKSDDLQAEEKMPGTEYSVEDLLSVMSGPPYTQETLTSDETSPLIQSDAEPFVGARHSFDNLASVESNSKVVGCHPNVGLTLNNNHVNNDKKNLAESLPWKRRKPSLKILIPDAENDVTCNLKQMSATAERQIDEAIELANTLDRMWLSQRTPGSVSDGCSSPGSHFLFKCRKNHHAAKEKKTFAELNSHTAENDRVMTPAALQAYDALVAMSAACKLEDSSKVNNDDDENLNRRSWESSGSHSSSSSSSSSSNEIRTPLPSCLELERSREAPNLFEGVSRKNDNNVYNGFVPVPVVQSNADSVLPKLTENFQKVPQLQDDMPPPTYQAPSPPKPQKTDISRRPSTQEQISDGVVGSSPPPLPEKKSRNNLESQVDEDMPTYHAPCPPAPVLPPPALPPRVPLRQSTVNSKPYLRRFPLMSETSTTRSMSEASGQSNMLSGNCGTYQHLEKCSLTNSRSQDHGGCRQVTDTRQKGLSTSVESRSSCDSDLGNLTHESEDSVFSDSTLSHANKPPCVPARSVLLTATDSDTKTRGRPLKINIKEVKLNAAELGIYDKADLFWVKSVNFDLPEQCQLESDLQDISAPIPGRYETSDSVSYEDLMEFALDRSLRKSSSNSLMCEEVCLLLKMFSNDITVEDCMDALAETFWDVHSAVKLIKLKQIMSTGLADKQQCKQALLFCKWNVNDAALYLLTPPQQRVTPNLVDV